MIPIRKKLNALAPLALLLLASTTASAWYDPGVQRWINRDPIEDSHPLFPATNARVERPDWPRGSSAVPQGFRQGTSGYGHRPLDPTSHWDLKHLHNLYQFLYNSPVSTVDPDGRIPIEGPCVMWGHKGSQHPSDGWPCFVACAALVTAGYASLDWLAGGFFGDPGDAMGTIVFGLAACALACGML